MSNTTVLVTGSSSGFGELTSKLLAEKGYHVFATMRNVNGKNEDKARELRDWADGKGHKLDVIELDVTDDKSVESAVQTAIEKGGKIDIVVNNAGIGAGGISETFTTEQFQQLFNVNVFGVHRVNRAVLPDMRRRRSGLLVHVSSAIGRLIFPFLGAYCPSKFALEAYAESLSQELAPLGIESIIVEPGGYATDFFGGMQQPKDAARIGEYGDVAKIPEQMFAGMGEMLNGPDAPDPNEVSKAILKLVETPTGKRPLRTVVDKIAGQLITDLNAKLSDGQKQLMSYYGS